MCLHLLEKPRIQKRKTTVVFFKVLGRHYDGGHFQTPFRFARYRSGDTKQVAKFSGTVGSRQRLFRDSFPVDEIVVVNRGLHGYKSLAAAKRGAYCGGRIIVRCVIPPNTPFIRGKKGEVVTLALEVGKGVYGKKSLLRQFNGE